MPRPVQERMQFQATSIRATARSIPARFSIGLSIRSGPKGLVAHTMYYIRAGEEHAPETDVPAKELDLARNSWKRSRRRSARSSSQTVIANNCKR